MIYEHLNNWIIASPSNGRRQFGADRLQIGPELAANRRDSSETNKWQPAPSSSVSIAIESGLGSRESPPAANRVRETWGPGVNAELMNSPIVDRRGEFRGPQVVNKINGLTFRNLLAAYRPTDATYAAAASRGQLDRQISDL